MVILTLFDMWSLLQIDPGLGTVSLAYMSGKVVGSRKRGFLRVPGSASRSQQVVRHEGVFGFFYNTLSSAPGGQREHYVKIPSISREETSSVLSCLSCVMCDR